MLVNRFSILRKPFPSNVRLSKVTATVRCLCILHNFCINEFEISNLSVNHGDSLEIMRNGGIANDDHNQSQDYDHNLQSPTYLLQGSEHMDDVPRHLRFPKHSHLFAREQMVNSLISMGYNERPAPRGSTTTNK